MSKLVVIKFILVLYEQTSYILCLVLAVPTSERRLELVIKSISLMSKKRVPKRVYSSNVCCFITSNCVYCSIVGAYIDHSAGQRYIDIVGSVVF